LTGEKRKRAIALRNPNPNRILPQKHLTRAGGSNREKFLELLKNPRFADPPSSSSTPMSTLLCN
jgi:hypothetical protein